VVVTGMPKTAVKKFCSFKRNNLNAFFSSCMHKLFAYFMIFMLGPYYLFGQESTQAVLNRIPEDEKLLLEQLFYSLFNGEHFSYTLFGDKPMSFSNYSTTLFDDNEDFPSLSELKFRKRWKTWKKYESFFPMNYYLLIECSSDRKNKKNIYFINKKYFVDTVDKHLSLFQSVLKENITGRLLLAKIENNPNFLSFLNDQHLLLGILLGYGEHNARLYHKRAKLSPFIYKKEIPTPPIQVPNPSKGFTSLQEEFDSYFAILTLFGDPNYSPLIIHPVHFVADHNHPETKILQEKYKDMQGKLSAIYSKRNFLEVTLLKLTEK
jgi:hypothetical protein